MVIKGCSRQPKQFLVSEALTGGPALRALWSGHPESLNDFLGLSRIATEHRLIGPSLIRRL